MTERVTLSLEPEINELMSALAGSERKRSEWVTAAVTAAAQRGGLIEPPPPQLGVMERIERKLDQLAARLDAIEGKL